MPDPALYPGAPHRSQPLHSPFARRLGSLCSWLTALLVGIPTLLATSDDQPTVVLILGAPGEPAFGSDFARTADLWQTASHAANANLHLIGRGQPHDPSDLDQFQNLLASLPHQTQAPLWIVLIGHGTFDGRDARFNLRGPDFTAEDLEAWLHPFQRPIAIINGASASGPFLQPLSGPDRVIVTATRSGYEQNYARFGLHFAQTLTDPTADLDKDGQISILESFLVAARRVSEFYEAQGRLATEHALLDDNADGRGTPADWFEGLRVNRQAADGALPDGFRARQWHLVPSEAERLIPPALRQLRNQLELDIAQLRERKPAMDDTLYYRQLEAILLELAHLYQSLGLLSQPPEG
jgi:hypothetical protein